MSWYWFAPATIGCVVAEFQVQQFGDELVRINECLGAQSCRMPYENRLSTQAPTSLIGSNNGSVSLDPVSTTVNECAAGGVNLENADACVSAAGASAHVGAWCLPRPEPHARVGGARHECVHGHASPFREHVRVHALQSDATRCLASSRHRPGVAASLLAHPSIEPAGNRKMARPRNRLLYARCQGGASRQQTKPDSRHRQKNPPLLHPPGLAVQAWMRRVTRQGSNLRYRIPNLSLRQSTLHL